MENRGNRFNRWNQLENKMRGIPGMEEGILETVVGLNAFGITTRQSCEGHLDWGWPCPWVDIGEEGKKGEKKLEKFDLINRQFHKLFGSSDKSEIKKTRMELDQAQEEMMKPVRLMARRLLYFLEKFCKEKPTTIDVRLIGFEFTPSCRLTCQGWFLQYIRTDSERAKYLEIYRKEMREFGQFLKNEYFGGKHLPSMK
jgi:hypothetical protein